MLEQGFAVHTYATRLSFIALVPYARMPELFQKCLRYVPPSVLAALILPELLRPTGPLDLSLGNRNLGCLDRLADTELLVDDRDRYDRIMVAFLDLICSPKGFSKS